MSSYVRSGNRFATSDWFTSNYTISTNAERQRTASHDTRQESIFLRNETTNKTKWDQLDNNTRLADRVDHIRKWKDILDKTLADLDREIAALSDAKEKTEIHLESMNLPTEVNVENLVQREGRQDIDIVQDEIEDQLFKEKEVIAGIKKQLQTKIDEAFEQLCILQEARQQILADLQDKNVAFEIDVTQYNLTEESPGISYKPDPLRVPKGSTTPQQWEDFSRYNKERSEAEMEASRRLREAIHQVIHQTTNDLRAQKLATEYALRRRIHEFEQALDELYWQKKQTEEEIADLENQIRQLAADIRAKINPSKLAETRLENRTYRPGVELCRDNVQYGLTDEVKQIQASKMALEEKMKQAQHALDGLEQNLHRINTDIQCKTNSLTLDKACMKSRERLNDPEVYPSQYDRNLHLTGVLRTKTSILA